MVFDYACDRAVVLCECVPGVGAGGSHHLHAVAQTCGVLEVIGFEDAPGAAGVAVPLVDAQLVALGGLRQVAGQDAPVADSHVAESERAAADAGDIELAQFVAALGVDDKNLPVLVDAVEFAVLVAEVADVCGVIALGGVGASLGGEVPAFGEVAQIRARVGDGAGAFGDAAVADGDVD